MKKALGAAGLLLLLALAGCMGGTQTTTTGPRTFEPDPRFGPGYNYTALDAEGLPVPVLHCVMLDPATMGTVSVGGGTATASPQAIKPEGSPPVCNMLMTPDPERQGNEVTIAVNPTDPRNIVGGAKDYYPPDAGQCVWDGVYVTHDGGRTAVQDRSFDGSPWRATSDPLSYKPNYASTFWCTTDPVAYFDVHGNFYYLLMAYQTDPVTGSKTGEDELPNGALNDWAFNRATQIVAVSSDGGDTFHTFTPVLEGSYPVSFHDKGWIAAGADGTIHVMWLASLAPGNVYFRSTDGGKTYSDPEVLATWPTGTAGQGSFVDVGTGTQVYAIWTSDSIHMRRSTDSGATWDEDRSVQGVNGAQHPGLSPRDRVTGFPALATDRNPDSPFADAVYLVWHDDCGNATWEKGCRGKGDNGSSIYVSASFDQGETFGEPLRVSGADERWRLLPALSVSPGGVVDVSWMEYTDEIVPASDGVEEHHRIRQMYSYSLDGGKTWSTPVDIRDADDGGWDPALCHHQNGMIFMGDYNDIDSSWQAAHPVWPDTRDEAMCKVYSATVQRPMFADGWDEAKRAKAEEFILAHPL